MYELMHLAFMTGLTATYQIASMGDATTLGGKFPQLLGIGKHLHGLAHDWNKAEGAEKPGQVGSISSRSSSRPSLIACTTRWPARIATRHCSTRPPSSTVAATATTNKNYPSLAGGRGLGFGAYGRYLKYGEDTPFANVFATMLKQTGANQPLRRQHGHLPELLAQPALGQAGGSDISNTEI